MAKKNKEYEEQVKDANVMDAQVADPNSTESKQHIPFSVVESYKTIRTNLMFLLSHDQCKRVIFSSSNAGEGKSTTSINIAIAFAQTGSKVLLIDADMRRPSIYKKMKLSNQKGLSSVLVGFCQLEEALCKINPYFDIINAGPIPPSPSEMLGSDKMEELLDKLSKQYDYIFIDMPPVNVVSDALILAPKTDGIVFIVQDLITTHEEFQKALSSIEFANVKLLGVVLNGSSKSKRSKYRYRYMTGRRYGYSYSSYGGYGYRSYGYK